MTNEKTSIKDIVQWFNELSGHAERGFSNLEFALACNRDNLTMADSDGDYADDDEDGNGESQWAMFHAGCEFFSQIAKCFIDGKEPDYKAIYDEVVEQLMFSIKRYKEKRNGRV